MVTARLLLAQEPKVRKASEAQKGHKELQVQLAQLAQQGLPVPKAQQVLTVQMALTELMEQQAHKGRKALRVLRVHRATRD